MFSPGGGVKPISTTEFRQKLDEPGVFWFCFIAGRQRIHKWLMNIEKTFYPPGTPENDKFQMMAERCFDEPPVDVFWVGVPAEDKDKIESTIAASKLEIRPDQWLILVNLRGGRLISNCYARNLSGLEAENEITGKYYVGNYVVASKESPEIGIGFY